MAYFGRSQEQAWALALTAYGTEQAAAGAERDWAARHLTSSGRTCAPAVLAGAVIGTLGGSAGLILGAPDGSPVGGTVAARHRLLLLIAGLATAGQGVA